MTALRSPCPVASASSKMRPSCGPTPKTSFVIHAMAARTGISSPPTLAVPSWNEPADGNERMRSFSSKYSGPDSQNRSMPVPEKALNTRTSCSG
jgi:hypothetical protein